MNHRRKTDRGRHGKPKSNDEEITKAPLEINVCGGALRIRGFINDISRGFIVDTSADVTIASANLFVKIALTNNPDICLSSGIIKSLNDQAIPVTGLTTVESTVLKVSVWIVSIDEQRILGSDYLKTL